MKKEGRGREENEDNKDDTKNPSFPHFGSRIFAVSSIKKMGRIWVRGEEFG